MIAVIVIVGVVVEFVSVYVYLRRSSSASAKQRDTWSPPTVHTEARARAKREAEASERKDLATKRKAQEQLGQGKKKIAAPISVLGDRSGGTLACPKCGGTSFKAKRSAKNKTASIGATPLTGGASLLGLAKASEVKCVTCGTSYKRG